MQRLLDWLDHRIGYRKLLEEALFEPIPGGARWRYVWGSTLVFTFFLQLVTGIFLWMAYSPSRQTAWESVYYIQEHMVMGRIVRGMHHYAAQAMVVLMAIHLMQVIIDGAYKAPREINFWLGLILMQIVLGLALSGYLLPWDQKGYYATQVSTKIVGATPVIGEELQILVQGGKKYGHHTLTRFFAMHAGVFPGLLMLFLVLHLAVFRRHGITVRDPKRAPDTTFWPDQVLRDAVACLGVLAVVLGLAVFRGAELNAPADPSEPFSAARPEWYFLFLFRFLRFEIVEHFGLAFGAIYVPGMVLTIIFLMPLIARLKGGHTFNVAFMWVMAFVTAGLTALAVYEDAHDPDYQAAVAQAHRDAVRIRELAGGPDRIPVSGAVTLLRNDPFTQGPKLFAKHCAACHRYNGHNGLGRPVTTIDPKTQQPVPAPPTAADLGNFGTREWFRSLLLDYSNHFAPLKNAAWYREAKQKAAAGEQVEFIDPDESEMAEWSRANRETLLRPENAEAFRALVEFLVSLSGRKDLKVDRQLVAAGREVALDGELPAGQMDACADCHDTIGEPLEVVAEGSGYPSLAEYGSQKWLRLFLSDPGHPMFYGEKNRMPAYGQKLTPHQLDMLVRWLTHDYLPSRLESDSEAQE